MTGRADRSKPAEIDEDVARQFAAMGITIKSKPAEKAERDFEVMEENWPSLLLFLDLQTQWRRHIGIRGHITWQGLDYTAVEALMRIERVKDKKTAMRDLRAMEAAALPVLNGGSPAKGDSPWH